MQFMFAYFLIYSENYATFLIDQIKKWLKKYCTFKIILLYYTIKEEDKTVGKKDKLKNEKKKKW